MNRRIQRLPAIFAFFALTFFVSPLAFSQTGDAPGTKDHPLVTRYAGSSLIGYDAKEYDAFTLALGPATYEERKWVAAKRKDLEGKVTRLQYVGPAGRSSLEVFRNYQSAFQQAGFETLYTCSTTECGRNFLFAVYPSSRYLRIPSPYNRGALSTNVSTPYYMAATKTMGGSTVYISLFTTFHNGVKAPNALLEIVEMKAMDTGMVSVNADKMASTIESTGRIALYGIYFDLNSAQIKSESKPQLLEIAKLLQQNPSLNLLVVGHTDNQGGHDYNMDLSRRRATSVVNALVSEHGIQKSRLEPAGMGFLAPVASNATEEGRAKNRRVELVKK